MSDTRSRNWRHKSTLFSGAGFTTPVFRIAYTFGMKISGAENKRISMTLFHILSRTILPFCGSSLCPLSGYAHGGFYVLPHQRPDVRRTRLSTVGDRDRAFAVSAAC